MEDKKIFKEIDLKYAYASFGLRFLSFIIDLIVIAAIFNIIKKVLYIDNDIQIYGLSMLNLINWLVSLSYFAITSLLTKGQSLGKMITGLRVVSLDGKDLSKSQIIIREIGGRYIQNKFMFLYLLAIFTPKKQSFIDLFVDTTVVKENVARDLYDIKF